MRSVDKSGLTDTVCPVAPSDSASLQPQGAGSQCQLVGLETGRCGAGFVNCSEWCVVSTAALYVCVCVCSAK